MSGRRAVAGGLTVRGTCTAGHVTEASTDKGRTTWEGTCATDGCELPVKARQRVAAPPPSAPAVETPPPATPDATATPKPKVKQVDYDAQPRKRDRAGGAQRAGVADPGDNPDPAEPAAPAASVQRRQRRPAAAAGAAVEPAAEQSARGRRIRERITGRRAAEDAPPRAKREFHLPY